MNKMLSLWLAGLLFLTTPCQAVVMIGFGQSAGGCAGGADGYIGHSTLGTDAVDGGTNLIYYSYFTPTTDGTFSYAHAWKLYNYETYRIGLFTSSGVLLASTISQTGGADPIAAVHAAIEPYCLVAGTTYILGFWRPAAWSGVGVSEFIGSPSNVYYQTLSTFGSFTPANTVRSADRAITITLNNAVSTF